MSVETSQPIASIPRGISAGGPTSVTCAPISVSAWMFERATREWSTSPTIATCSPSTGPTCSSIVYRSSSAWVGCWCFPSPALTTCAPVTRATRCGAPICCVPDHDHVGVVGGERQRRVLQRLALVDRRSPRRLIDITSAESRFAASSKLDDVRVEDSKNRFTTVRPRSVGSFFTSRSSERSKLRAVASSRSTSSRVRSAIEIRCRRGGVGAAAAARRARGGSRSLAPPPGSSRTRSTSSTSTSWTWTRSPRAVGRFLPT